MREHWSFFEEYATPADKRRAQRGARYGKPTGKARAYLAVLYAENNSPHGRDAIAPLYDTEPGETSPVCSSQAAYSYLQQYCRRVGKWYIPEEWRKRFAPYFPELGRA